jgi:hypothetical protein
MRQRSSAEDPNPVGEHRGWRVRMYRSSRHSGEAALWSRAANARANCNREPAQADCSDPVGNNRVRSCPGKGSTGRGRREDSRPRVVATAAGTYIASDPPRRRLQVLRVARDDVALSAIAFHTHGNSCSNDSILEQFVMNPGDFPESPERTHHPAPLRASIPWLATLPPPPAPRLNQRSNTRKVTRRD